MKKPIAVSLSLLILMGAVGCSAPEQSMPEQSTQTQASPTATPAALNPSSEEIRIEGEKTLNSLYEIRKSEGFAQVQKDLMRNGQIESILFEAAFEKNKNFIEGIEEKATLDELWDTRVWDNGVLYAIASQESMERFYLMGEIRDLTRSTSDTAEKYLESVKIFPGTEANANGDFVLSGNNVYLADENGAIITNAPVRGTLINSGKTFKFYNITKTLESAEQNGRIERLKPARPSYDAELYAKYKKSIQGIDNVEEAVDKLNSDHEANGTYFEIVAKHDVGHYIKVSDDKSTLASKGDLLYVFNPKGLAVLSY